MVEIETCNKGELYTLEFKTSNYLFYEIMHGVAWVLAEAEKYNESRYHPPEIPALKVATLDFMAKEMNLPQNSPPDTFPPDMKPPAPFANGGLVVGVDLANAPDITVDVGELIAPPHKLSAMIAEALAKDFKRGYMNDK
jgi:hypothetical protein